jgi:hypothetical protein
MMEGFEINRSPEIGVHNILEVFKGLENADVLKKIFGGEKNLEQALQNLQVRITKARGYMWVDEENRCVCISFDYLSCANKRYIYLDIVHELVHIKQMMDGKKLFDRNYSYVERPTEIEAYKVTVDEAKRIGMKENEIRFYMNVEWVDHEDRLKLLTELGLV